MFHNFITLTTMITVVLHALLGCCVHHAHADHTHSHVAKSVVADVEPCHGHHHDDHEHRGADVHEDCGNQPCSGSHGQHQSCDEADCNIVAEQRGNDIELVSVIVWSSLLTDSLLLSSQDFFALRQQVGPPPDPHSVVQPLHVQNQVWRL